MMLLLFLILWIFHVQAQAKYYASLPSPSMPMSVKTPYLNAWLNYGNGTGPGTNVPIFWANWNVGLEGLIRVDKQMYQWMGPSALGYTPVKTISQYISPTRSILVVIAGPVQMNITWLSPIEPDDWAKQSFPFTYYYIDITSKDGVAHSIQLYTEITGEWLAHDTESLIGWNTTETDAIMYHQVQLQTQQPMKEVENMTQDLTVYLAAEKKYNLSWQSGFTEHFSQKIFNDTGMLANVMNTTYRNINLRPDGYPVMAFSHDLSTITSTDSPVIWSLGAVRDPVISYKVGTNVQLLSAPYWSKTNSISNSIGAFFTDFSTAVSRADTLDSKIMNDGLQISPEYADILALCLRQVMASLDITISKDDNGNWNNTDIKTFIKDIGSSSRINAVDHLYATFPALLYINSSLPGSILAPLLEQQSNLNAYSAIGDIGQSYPLAWGNVTSEPQLAITYSGDMLFMLAVHAKKSGDTSLILQYYEMLKRWTEFLVSTSLHPGTTYVTTDEVNYPNMSNLALQGIVGIHAMSAIAEILGKKDDMTLYSRNASTYLSQWQNLVYTGNHLATGYQNSTSWSLMYNLYAAKMLSLEVDQKILDTQSQFYELQATSPPIFGFSDTSEGVLTRAYWLLLTAATTTTTSARDILIKQVHDRFFWNGTSDFPCPSTYNKNSGASSGWPGGRAGQTLGASFAFLALNLTDKILTSSTNSTSAGIPPSQTFSPISKRKNIKGIVGGVLGGIIGLFAICAGGFFLYKYKERRERMIYTTKARRFEANSISSPAYQAIKGWISPAQPSPGRNGAVYNPFQLQELQHMCEQRRVENQNNPFGSTSVLEVRSTGSPGATSGPSGSASETLNATLHGPDIAVLRDEVEMLRQELAEVRAAALEAGAPPTYDYMGSEMDDLHRRG